MYVYNADAKVIRARLESGASLVACLCTERCHRCGDWWGEFRMLSNEFAEACFVWLDVDEHPDLVADIPCITAYPFLLIQTGLVCAVRLLETVPADTTTVQSNAVRLLETVPADATAVRALLRTHLAKDAAPLSKSIIEPGLFSFLLE